MISVISILNLKPDDLGLNIDEVMMMMRKLSISHLPLSRALTKKEKIEKGDVTGQGGEVTGGLEKHG